MLICDHTSSIILHFNVELLSEYVRTRDCFSSSGNKIDTFGVRVWKGAGTFAVFTFTVVLVEK